MNSQPESPVTSLNLTVATTSRAPMSEMQSIYELVQGSETIDKQACVDILSLFHGLERALRAEIHTRDLEIYRMRSELDRLARHNLQRAPSQRA